MNLDQLRGNVGWRMRIAPQAIHLDEYGRELPGKNEDWIVRSVSDAEIEIEDAGFLARIVRLGKDHVQSFATDPQRAGAAGVHYGMLKLHMQMYIPPAELVWLAPCVRPGERVDPPPAQIIELVVDSTYPRDTGLRAKLINEGYQDGWAKAARVPTLEHQGWEVVVERDRQGRPTSYHQRTAMCC